MQNYIADMNRFNLAGPPVWWLRQLAVFDPSLVVVPSRQSPLYRLAQRRRLQLPEKMTNDALFNESDTKMLASYSLIPVTSIIATINWNDPAIWSELRRRAPWRLGGATEVISKLEAQEAQDELSKKAQTDEQLEWLSRDAWKYYNKKIGVRSHLYIPKTSQPSRPRSPLLRIK
jgi:hypothetical protein